MNESTITRIEKIARFGKPFCHHELKTYHVLRHSPPNTRDAIFGGRIKVMRLHYKKREGEESVQYVDMLILKTYVLKYIKFPVGTH